MLFVACRVKTEEKKTNGCIVWWIFDCLLLSDLLSSHLSLALLPIACRDHIYTVDTDTANSDEIFFSKVSQTPVSLRTCCTQHAVSDSVTLITWLLVPLCVFVCTWVYACACQQSYSLAHRCVPAVLTALTLLRRLSNQSASKLPASSTLISGTAGWSDVYVTEAEKTIEEVREWEEVKCAVKREGKRDTNEGHVKWD